MPRNGPFALESISERDAAEGSHWQRQHAGKIFAISVRGV
jgi:hypothetical protein